MSQKFKQSLEESEAIDKTSLREQFENARNKQVKKADTRIVNIKVRVGCGCGGAYEKYNIEVPMNSPIKNGQYFSDFDDDWKNVKDGWV